MTCPLCSSLLITQKDTHYYVCDTCKALVKDEKEYLTAAEEKAHYECHNNDVEDVRYQNFTMPITQYVLENRLSTHKGLDFGCGTGPVISRMLHKKSYDIVPYDPFFAPNQNVLESTYDYIVCCEVMEHFHNPKAEIDRLTGLLKPNGLLVIMTLLYTNTNEFANWHYRNDPTHIFIYTPETIQYIAKEKELEILELTDRLIVLKKTV